MLLRDIHHYCCLRTYVTFLNLGEVNLFVDQCVQVCVYKFSSAPSGSPANFQARALTLSTRSANILAHELYTHSAMHQYIGAGVSTHVSNEAKRAFGVNPFLLSSNKCRPHHSTYITRREDGRGGASSPSFEKGREGPSKWSFFFNIESKQLPYFT